MYIFIRVEKKTCLKFLIIAITCKSMGIWAMLKIIFYI